MRVVLAGGEAAGLRALRLVLDRGLVLRAVAAADPALAAAAEKAGIEVLDSALLAEPATGQWFENEQIDLLLNAHSLHIVSAEVLAALRVGGYNLHPGPLPAYAGLNVPSWAVINGEPRHAVTLHEMTPVVDAGGVVGTAWFDLDDRSTGLSVSSQCARLGIELLTELIDQLTAGAEITTEPIVGQRRLYRRADRPHDGRVPWTATTATIDRLVRGCSYHPMPSPIGTPTTTAPGGAIGILSGAPDAGPANLAVGEEMQPGQVIVTDTEAEAGDQPVVSVRTGDGFYRVDRVVVDGRTVAATDVLTDGSRLL